MKQNNRAVGTAYEQIALEAVDTKKQKRLYRCAQQYVAAHKIPDAPARFDVVAIEGHEVCHIENAFEGA